MDAKKKEPLSTEYPKSLYKGGDRTAEHTVVVDSDEERNARKAGFKMIDKQLDQVSVARLEAEAAAAEEQAEAPAKPKGKGK